MIFLGDDDGYWMLLVGSCLKNPGGKNDHETFVNLQLSTVNQCHGQGPSHWKKPFGGDFFFVAFLQQRPAVKWRKRHVRL